MLLETIPLIVAIMQATVISADFICDDSVVLNGSGSQNLQALLSDIIASYKSNRSLTVGQSVIINPQPENTTYSIQRLLGPIDGQPQTIWTNGETFFFEESGANRDDIQMIPVAQQGLVPIFRIPGITSLNLTVSIWTDVYLGNIRSWNDTRLQAINPGTVLPNEDIQVVARVDDNSAYTKLLTAYFSKNSAEWRTKYGEFASPNFTDGKCCKSRNWPPHIKIFANKVVGMQSVALTRKFMIGYGSLSDVTAAGLTAFSLKSDKSSGDSFLTCSIDTINAAYLYFVVSTSPNQTSFHMFDAPSSVAWPVTFFHYMAFSKSSLPKFSCCQQQELIGFLDYLLFMDEATKAAKRYSFSATQSSANMSARIAKNILSKIVCDGENVYEDFKHTLVPNSDLLPYQQALIAIAAIVLLILGLVLSLLLWRRTALMHERHWLISSKALNLQMLVTDQSLSSIRSSMSSKKESSMSSKQKVDLTCNVNLQFSMPRSTLDDKAVMLLDLDTTLPKHWQKDTKLQLFRFCQRLAHASVIHFYGVSVIGSRVFAVQEFLSKGTLHYALVNARFDFTETIKVSMAGDIADGIAYLHSRGIVHGLLNSLSCYVSSSWTIKIANWMVSSIMVKETPTMVDFLFKYDKEDVRTEKKLIPLIYLHVGAKKTGKFSQQSDLFSFGMLVIELINRMVPYAVEVGQKKTTFYQVLKNKTELNLSQMPELATGQASSLLLKLAKSCINEKFTSMQDVLAELQAEQFHGSITDILMETMEGMITEMEKKSEELNKATMKMRELLNEVLPASIAEKLSNGLTVEPEYFECVSIFFSDIVGFTTISANSSPMEVMAFLNDLWIAFDSVIEQHDCYKVDTIGDAYMVCSGLPNRNGVLHAKHIVELSLSLLRKAAVFVIRHMPGEPLRIRVGINSGPVTAGVVGTKMPQYCVFGDTVNTANRMESTGQPGRVQVSETTAKLLSANFPQYKLERRGDVEVKGKGVMNTYWLDTSSVVEPWAVQRTPTIG